MYNNYVMARNTPILWFLRQALGLMLLMGLLPVSHILSMQTGHMPMSSQTASRDGAMPTEQNMPIPCCNETIGSFHLTCGFVVPHSAFATHSVGTDRVALMSLFLHPIFREIATPPPKI
jgi:hypothetical protein